MNEQKKKDYYDKLMAVLENPANSDIIWVQDLCAMIPISTRTFYEYFPPESNEFHTIRGLLENNRIALHRFATNGLKDQVANGSTSAAIYLNKITQSREQKEHMLDLQDQQQTEKIEPPSVNFIKKDEQSKD